MQVGPKSLNPFIVGVKISGDSHKEKTEESFCKAVENPSNEEMWEVFRSAKRMRESSTQVPKYPSSQYVVRGVPSTKSESAINALSSLI